MIIRYLDPRVKTHSKEPFQAVRQLVAGVDHDQLVCLRWLRGLSRRLARSFPIGAPFKGSFKALKDLIRIGC